MAAEEPTASATSIPTRLNVTALANHFGVARSIIQRRLKKGWIPPTKVPRNRRKRAAPASSDAPSVATPALQQRVSQALQHAAAEADSEALPGDANFAWLRAVLEEPRSRTEPRGPATAPTPAQDILVVSDPEPESTSEEFERWLDRQGFDKVEHLFDGSHWDPKVSAKHPRVRKWLRENLQAQRLHQWLQENRQAQGSREARSTRNAAINMKFTAGVSAVIASARILWQSLIGLKTTPVRVVDRLSSAARD